MDVKQGTTVVIGAGPYGLSVASHLKKHGVQTLVFGKTMELWKNMPSGLFLKSIWTASSISDPVGDYSIDRYAMLKGLSRQEPIPLSFFLDYASWFQQNNVPNIDQTYVQSLVADRKGFHINLADGRSIEADRVVLASGISTFVNVPDYARNLPDALAGHTSKLADLTPFQGRRVLVVGNGQSALEYAALLNEAGASVELIARGEVRWHTKMLYERTGPARHIFYPPGDVGPPGINWLVAFPRFYRHLPDRVKFPVHRRAVLPGGAKWLRPRIEGHVQITEKAQIVKATPRGQGLCLALNDGTTREVDYLLLGTGYQPGIQKLPYIDAALREKIRDRDGYPILDASYEASVPGMYFAGILAGRTFGPTCRFVSGTKALARQISYGIAHSV